MSDCFDSTKVKSLSTRKYPTISKKNEKYFRESENTFACLFSFTSIGDVAVLVFEQNAQQVQRLLQRECDIVILSSTDSRQYYLSLKVASTVE